MAGRVNRKFVVGLVAAAAVVLGAGLYLFWSVVNKTGETHAAEARQFEAVGNWREAEESWGRAVGHEKTNLEWLDNWRNALGNVVPRTRTEYESDYNQYRMILRQIATVTRDDIEVTEEYLDFRFAFLRRVGSSNRRSVEGLVNEIDSFLVWYPEGGELEDERDRLRRYRGIAWASLSGPASTITQEEIDKAMADLDAAFAVMPEEGEIVRSMTMLLDTQESRARAAQRREQAEAFSQAQFDRVNTLLEADPDNAWGRVTKLELEMENLARLSGAEREARQAELRDETRDLLAWLTEHAGETDPRVFARANTLEALLDEEANLSGSIAVYTAAAEALNQRTDMLLQLAALYDRAGDYDRAVNKLREIEAQERLPVSVEGYMRMSFKMQAPRMLCEFTLAEMGRTEDAAEKRRLLDAARAARDRFTQEVGEEVAQVSMLDGQLAVSEAELLRIENDMRAAEDAYARALGHFSRYNELTEYLSSDGLWREGRVATVLNKTGLARDRFEQMLQIEPNNPKVLLALAEVEERLGTTSSLKEAARLTERALDLAPTNESIRQKLASLRELTFSKRPDDPVKAIVYEAERLLLGENAMAPDSIAAEKLLRDGWEEYPGNPQIARQLVRVLMQSDRIDDAKAFVAQAREDHPDEEFIATLARRLEADNLLEIMLIGIRESELTELNKQLETVELCRRFNELERAREALEQAIAIAPDDPDVVEQQFLQLLAENNLDAAADVAERAAALNADRLDGITFEARLASARGETDEAIVLLREAVSRRPTDAPLWRLLAGQQVDKGWVNEALDSYKQALAITESDTTTIRGYVATLASAGRRTEALAEARRLKEFGERDPGFLDLYLRLEASAGGEEGRRTAIARRRQIMGERPFDTQNKLELANLYIENRQWGEAKSLLDQIKADGNDSLTWVQVMARWYADQGKVKTDTGFEDGIDLARGAFVDHIVSNTDGGAGVDAYLAMAQFMVQRGRIDVAMRAIEEARPLQDPTTLRAEKLYGELMMATGRSRAAAEAYRKVVEAGADDGRDTYRKLLIEMLLRISEFEAASSQLDALAGDNSTDLTVLMQRADIAMSRGDRDEAMRLVDKAIEVHPSQSLPFIKRAQYLMTDENLWRDAQRNLEEALRLSPNDPQAHRLMATMHYRQNREGEAIASLRASLQADPDQDAILLGLLIELIDANRAGEALDVANEVIEKRKSDAVLMLNISRVFGQRGEYDRANVILDRAWRLTKDSRVGLAYIQNLLSSDPPRPQVAAQVVSDLELLGAEINEDPIILATRANIEQKSGKSQRAVSFLTRAYERSLENPGLLMQWFLEVRRTLGTDESAPEAIRFLSQYRDQMPAGTEQRDWLTYGLALLRTQDNTDIPEAESDLMALQADGATDLVKRLSHRLLGSGRFGREEYDAAAEAWRAGIEAFPDDWEMHNNLAYVLGVELDRPEEAIPLARQATQLQDGRSDVHDTLGTLLLATGELDEAEDALLKAKERVRSERENVTVLLNMARLALARGNTAEAKRLWTQADTTVLALPGLRGQAADDLAEVKAQIDSAPRGD